MYVCINSSPSFPDCFHCKTANCNISIYVCTLIFQGLPRSTRFLESIVSYLPDWRKAAMPFPVIAWNTFIDHVRVNINPLAADDHMKEVIQQLQLMGEVIYVKGMY